MVTFSREREEEATGDGINEGGRTLIHRRRR